MINGKLNIEHEFMTIGTYDEEKRWKESAGQGEWNHEPFDFGVWVDNATGYTCAIKRNHGGAWCGYVYPGADHPIHEPEGDIGFGHGLEEGNPVWLDVHGGVTLHSAMEVPHDLASGIAVGFDCAHSGDTVPGYPWAGGEYRTASFVIAEVRKLAKQIHAYRPIQQLVG